jgi:hypothetical protein
MKGKFFCGALLLMAAATSFGSIVYDNTTTFLNENMPLLPEWLNDSAEVGDEVNLAGTDRTVTGLKLLFYYRGNIPGTFDARIRFRVYNDSLGKPDLPFYESGLTQVTTLAGMNEFNFAIPYVVVPDRFIWTIQAYNRQGSVGEIGPAYFNPPTVGSSEDYFWQHVSGEEWSQYNWGGEPVANFGATITAVPEPATGLLLLAGLASIARRRRR